MAWYFIGVYTMKKTRHEISLLLLKSIFQARFKRQTLHVPNLMQMRKIYCFRSFALDSGTCKVRRLKWASVIKEKFCISV